MEFCVNWGTQLSFNVIAEILKRKHPYSHNGCFLMSACPSTFSNEEDRAVWWQFFFPVVDCVLTNHHAELSTFIRVINIIYIVMLNLRRTTTGCHAVGKHVIKTLTWFRQEKVNEVKSWSSNSLSYHIIMILDELINCLRRKTCRSYFFQCCNALTNSFRNSLSPSSSSDYDEDAAVIETFINRIHALSSSELIGHQMISEERRFSQFFAYETMLIDKWIALSNNMVKDYEQHQKPCSAYPPKQVEYITAIFRALLITRSVTQSSNNCKVVNKYKRASLNYPSTGNVSVEDACYVLSVLFHQAKVFFLRSRHAQIGPRRASKNSLKLDEKSETQYRETIESAASKIRENPLRVIGDEFQAVKLILQTFYEASTASKVARKILKPYSELFFVETFKNCWYLDEWKSCIYSDELMALRVFSRLVSESKLSCKAGLLDALEKNWDWASDLFKLCVNQKSGLELLFTYSDGKCRRERLTFDDTDVALLSKLRMNTRNFKYERQSTVNELREILESEEKSDYLEGELSTYFQLRNGSPITQIVNKNRRKGIHLGLGNIVTSLVALGKFTLLQEVTRILPEEKRQHALESIQATAKMKHRHTKERRKLNSTEEIYKILPDLSDPSPKVTNADEWLCDPSENRLCNTNQSGISTIGKCSTFIRKKFSKKRASFTYDCVAYYDAPVTYFQSNAQYELKNPTSQPYLRLSSDKHLSLMNSEEANSSSL